jgi:hypothetical protein
MILQGRSSGTTLRRACRAYREAAISYDRAFTRGDVRAIEDAFSRMQEIGRAFDQGIEWASQQSVKSVGRPASER